MVFSFYIFKGRTTAFYSPVVVVEGHAVISVGHGGQVSPSVNVNQQTPINNIPDTYI